MAKLALFLNILMGGVSKIGPITSIPYSWIDASHVTKDGSNRVSVMQDQSGHGRDFSQATLGSQPIWSANGINSLPVVTANGTSQYIYNTSPGWFPAASTIFMVLTYDDANLNANHVWICDSVDATLPGPSASVMAFLTDADEYVVNTAGTTRGPATLDHAAHVLTIEYNSTTTNVREDGVQILTLPTSGYGQLGQVALLGGYANLPWNGKFPEMLWYNTTLSSGDRNAVELYLKNKYATP